MCVRPESPHAGAATRAGTTLSNPVMGTGRGSGTLRRAGLPGVCVNGEEAAGAAASRWAFPPVLRSPTTPAPATLGLTSHRDSREGGPGAAAPGGLGAADLETAESSDASLALALQLREVYGQQEPLSYSQARMPPSLDECILSDPVWGEVRFLPGAVPSRWQMACFGCCPCFMVGCGGAMRCYGRNCHPTPVEDAKRAWRRFLMSFAAILTILQSIALIVSVFLGGGFVPMRDNPSLGPHPNTFDLMGAKNPARVRYSHELWCLFTALLLHGGLLHFFMNMLVQLRTGVWLEVLWGSPTWLFVYIVTGSYSNLASCIFLPDALGVGSSGALCGVIGAGVVFIVFTWRQTLPNDVAERNMQLASLALTIVVTLLLSVLPMLDFAAHAGGFLAGAVLAVGLFAIRAQEISGRAVLVLRGGSAIGLCSLFGVSYVYFMLRSQPDRSLLHLCRPPDC